MEKHVLGILMYPLESTGGDKVSPETLKTRLNQNDNKLILYDTRMQLIIYAMIIP